MSDKKSSKFKELLKQVPLETRLRVTFQMEWLMMNIVPDRTATDDEAKKAVEWAKIITEKIMKEYAQWELDGRPTK